MIETMVCGFSLRSPTSQAGPTRPATTARKSVGNSAGPNDGWLDDDSPSKDELIAIIARDVAFESSLNRRKLMNFIKTISASS